MVVSSSGVSRHKPCRVQVYEIGLGEERIGPALMAGPAESETGAFFLFAQERPQPPPDHVEHRSHPVEAHARRAPCHLPDRIFEFVEALLADVPLACLEAIAQEREALARQPPVAKMGLGPDGASGRSPPSTAGLPRVLSPLPPGSCTETTKPPAVRAMR